MNRSAVAARRSPESRRSAGERPQDPVDPDECYGTWASRHDTHIADVASGSVGNLHRSGVDERRVCRELHRRLDPEIPFTRRTWVRRLKKEVLVALKNELPHESVVLGREVVVDRVDAVALKRDAS